MIMRLIIINQLFQWAMATNPLDAEFVESFLGELSPTELMSGDFVELLPSILDWISGFTGYLYPTDSAALTNLVDQADAETLDPAYSNEFDFVEDMEEIFDESDTDDHLLDMENKHRMPRPNASDVRLASQETSPCITPKSSQESLAPLV